MRSWLCIFCIRLFLSWHVCVVFCRSSRLGKSDPVPFPTCPTRHHQHLVHPKVVSIFLLPYSWEILAYITFGTMLKKWRKLKLVYINMGVSGRNNYYWCDLMPHCTCAHLVWTFFEVSPHFFIRLMNFFLGQWWNVGRHETSHVC